MSQSLMHLPVVVATRADRSRTAASRLAFVAMALIAADVAAQLSDSGQLGRNRAAQFGVRAGAGYSDNLHRAPVDPQPGTYTSLRFNTSLSQENRRLSADVWSDLEWRMYAEPGVDDQPYGTVSAEAEIKVVPNRLHWIVEEDFGQIRTGPDSNGGPDARESINVFSTGPRLDVPFGSRTYLRMQALYSDRRYSDTNDLNSDVIEIDAGVYRLVSRTARIGLAVNSWAYDDDEAARQPSVESIYLVYARELASGAVSLSLGQSRTDSAANPGAADEEHTTPFLDVHWSNEIGDRSNLQIYLQNGFVDASMGFVMGNARDSSPDSGTDELLTSDRYRRTLVGADYSISGERTSFSLGASVMESVYETESSLDNDFASFSLQLTRRVGRELSVGARGIFGKRTYNSTNQDNRDNEGSVWLRKRFGPQLDADVEIVRFSRRSASNQPFDENAIRAGIQYSFGAER